MSDRAIPLEQLRIDAPCTEAWDAMSGDDAKRFCAKCDKHVHDLSEMDRKEADALLGGALGHVCVRMRRDAAGRVVTRDYWKIAAGVALAAGVGACDAGAEDAAKPGPAQQGPQPIPHPVQIKPAPPVLMGAICVPPVAPASIKMFPPAKAGHKRVVIRLPEIGHDAQLEIVATRVENVDAVNRHFIGGTLEAKSLEGWGYPYYELSAAPVAAGTLMAGPPEKMAPRPTPVQIRGKGFEGLRYNSKLPMVLYVPENVEVSYRVWAPKGDPVPAKVE